MSGRPFSGGEVHLLRKCWNIPTVKINRAEHNPRQWPDGTYSVQGAAEALSISTQDPGLPGARKPATPRRGRSSCPGDAEVRFRFRAWRAVIVIWRSDTGETTRRLSGKAKRDGERGRPTPGKSSDQGQPRLLNSERSASI